MTAGLRGPKGRDCPGHGGQNRSTSTKESSTPIVPVLVISTAVSGALGAFSFAMMSSVPTVSVLVEHGHLCGGGEFSISLIQPNAPLSSSGADGA